MNTERRNCRRPEALHLLDYLVINDSGQQGEYSMGRTLNLSRGGALLETHNQLSPGQKILITMTINDHLIRKTGKVVHSCSSSGRHRSGIMFQDSTRNSHTQDGRPEPFEEYLKTL